MWLIRFLLVREDWELWFATSATRYILLLQQYLRWLPLSGSNNRCVWNKSESESTCRDDERGLQFDFTDWARVADAWLYLPWLTFAMSLELVLTPSWRHTSRQTRLFDGHPWRRSWEGWIWRGSTRLKLSLIASLRQFSIRMVSEHNEKQGA